MKIRWEKFALVILMCALIQGSLLFFFQVNNSSPDLFLLFVIFLSLNVDSDRALLTGWIIGICKDISSAGRLGFYGFLFMVAAFLVVKIRDEIFKGDVLTRMLLVFFVTIIINLLAIGYAKFVFGYKISTALFLSIILLSLYNLIMTPFIIPFFERLRMYKKLQP